MAGYNNLHEWLDPSFGFYREGEANNGCTGEAPYKCKVPPDVLGQSSEMDEMMQRVQGQHITLNDHLKFFQFERFVMP